MALNYDLFIARKLTTLDSAGTVVGSLRLMLGSDSSMFMIGVLEEVVSVCWCAIKSEQDFKVRKELECAEKLRKTSKTCEFTEMKRANLLRRLIINKHHRISSLRDKLDTQFI